MSNLKKLIIIGFESGGKEITQVVININRKNPEWDLIGYFDENNENINKSFMNIPVLGGWDWADNNSNLIQDSFFICTIGNPSVKKRIITRLKKEYKAKFVNIIDPSAIVADEVNLGEGNVIAPYCVIQPIVTIGNHNFISVQTIVGHDCSIGDFCTLNPGVIISGTNNIEDECYIGTGATTIQKLTIHKNSIIGAGAVVITDIPQDSTFVGVPAKKIK